MWITLFSSFPHNVTGCFFVFFCIFKLTHTLHIHNVYITYMLTQPLQSAWTRQYTIHHLQTLEDYFSFQQKIWKDSKYYKALQKSAGKQMMNQT